jgi:ATP-dependent RNA helicase RhlE
MLPLKNKPHVIIATPGRLNDHLQQGTANLHAVKILVLDEADRMLDMGFQPQIQRIVAKLSHERQTMLFSATMAPEIVNMAQRLMRLPVQIEVAPQGTAAEKVEHEVFMVAKDQKSALLQKLFQDYHGTILVFTRTKFAAKRLTKAARIWGHGAAELHSDRSLAQRREAMAGFKNGAYRILVATDIAARGIDVTNIELVINYDLPEQAEDYVHRIGRTGRASHATTARLRRRFQLRRLTKRILSVR